MDNNEVSMDYNGASSYLGRSRSFIIKTDEHGFFDTTFVLNQPAYYTINRNTVYLTPGDDLTIKITPKNTEAEFYGIGAEANNYLKDRLFPKAGSYLESGKNINGDFIHTKEYIDSLSTIRFHQLDTLRNVSDNFKQLERARIKGDIINSYISFFSYVGSAKVTKKLDIELPLSIKEHFDMIQPYINPLIKDISDEQYLDVAVVRDVMAFSTNKQFGPILFDAVDIPQRTKELYEASNMSIKLQSNITPEIAEEINNYAKTLLNRDFAIEIEDKIEESSKLFPGKPAIDFEIEDVDGSIIKLSNYKGRVIYIDLWATWCGPCINESPYFESLAAEYSDKEIVFLPISTDSDKELWLNYLSKNEKVITQYFTSDPKLIKEWNVRFIPRFILIDKDFKILNAYALRPSQDELKEVLNSLLD